MYLPSNPVNSTPMLIALGKVMLPPGEDGPTIEQEIEAGGQLGEVYDTVLKKAHCRSLTKE
jgi:hypothetical protein